jgi:uncharacterized membrane protein
METLENVGRSGNFDRISGQLALGLRNALERAPEIRNFLRGVWLGHPLHPVLTDVPIGAWTAAMVLDATTRGDEAGYGRAADNTILVGVIGALGAAVTGLTDWSATDGERRRLGLIHGLTNVTATSLFVLALTRRADDRDARRRLASVAYAFAMAGAYLGGHLVFRKEVGVHPLGPSAAAPATEHAL